MSRKGKKEKSRGVVDTNVLVAGISGFRKPYVRGKNPSADLLHKWAEKGNFVWLVTDDILDEYKEILRRLGVRPNLIGAVINLIRERAEQVNVRVSFEISPDPKDDPFCLCSEEGNADSLSR
ncbi:MAG TPA: PIN domain-containing protein [Candidatus Polarisedimenticolia bacterium]|nr:PIN domain-containing protein [Candidatus Polarisedimenticolia bacterium]